MHGVSYHGSKQALVYFSDRANSGKKPLRLSFLISRSIRLRSCAEEKPHHEGDAYISDAMLVALATSYCGGCRPWQRKTLRAYKEEAPLNLRNAFLIL